MRPGIRAEASWFETALPRLLTMRDWTFVSKVLVLSIQFPLSSSAKADDPVRRDVSVDLFCRGVLDAPPPRSMTLLEMMKSKPILDRRFHGNVL
jgi:hypothetical protein